MPTSSGNYQPNSNDFTSIRPSRVSHQQLHLIEDNESAQTYGSIPSNGQQAEQLNQRYTIESRPPPNPDLYLLKFYNLVSILTSISIIFTLLLQLSIILITTTSLTSFDDVTLLSFHIFSILFSVLGLCCEMEWTEFIRQSTILQSWITRGFFYVYIALILFRELKNLEETNVYFQNILVFGSSLLAILGLVYVLMVRI